MLKSFSSFKKAFLQFGTVGCFWAVGCPNPGAPVFIHPVREEARPQELALLSSEKWVSGTCPGFPGVGGRGGCAASGPGGKEASSVGPL